MTTLSIGDLAQTFQLRRDNARLNTTLAEITQELTTGQSAKPDTRLRGDYTIKAALSTDLTRNAALERAFDDFALETDSRQDALGLIVDLTREVSTTLLQVSSSAGPEARIAATQTAASRFDAVLSNLNVQLGGRSLFSGQAVNSPAVADAETIFASLETAITTAAATTPEEIEQVVLNWFRPGGEFDTNGYLGVQAGLLAPTQTGSFQSEVPTAFDPRLRDALAGLALASLVDRGVVDATTEASVELLDRASTILLNADQQLVNLRADFGTVQARNADAQAEITSKRFSLEQAIAGLTDVDPFEAAVALEATETQLQTLYSLTAKLSNLSLTDFLR